MDVSRLEQLEAETGWGQKEILLFAVPFKQQSLAHEDEILASSGVNAAEALGDPDMHKTYLTPVEFTRNLGILGTPKKNWPNLEKGCRTVLMGSGYAMDLA